MHYYGYLPRAYHIDLSVTIFGLFEWGCEFVTNISSDHDRKSQETTNSNVNDKSKVPVNRQ